MHAVCTHNPSQHGEQRVFLLSKRQKGKGSDILEVQVLKGEVGLHNARGLHSGAQHILLGGDVVGTGYPLQVVQVAGDKEERCCGSWTVGHDPPRFHGTSPHWPRVPCPSPSIVHSGWAVPSWDAQQGPHGHPGVTPAGHRQGRTPVAGVTRDIQYRGTGGQCAGTGSHAEDAAGAGGLAPFPWPFAQGGNGKRKIFSAMATSHSAGGNNRWRRAIYSQKHKGTASWEEAGGGRPERQGAVPWGAAAIPSPPREHRLPCCPQGPGRGGGQVPSVQHPPGLMRAAGGIKEGFDFSSSRCFNWVTTNGLL